MRLVVPLPATFVNRVSVSQPAIAPAVDHADEEPANGHDED